SSARLIAVSRGTRRTGSQHIGRLEHNHAARRRFDRHRLVTRGVTIDAARPMTLRTATAVQRKPASAPKVSAASPEPMEQAKKTAKALAKFFASTVKKFQAELAKNGGDRSKAVKATFGSKSSTPDMSHAIGRQSLSGALFYMSTLIDTRTGGLYQSVGVG